MSSRKQLTQVVADQRLTILALVDTMTRVLGHVEAPSAERESWHRTLEAIRGLLDQTDSVALSFDEASKIRAFPMPEPAASIGSMVDRETNRRRVEREAEFVASEQVPVGKVVPIQRPAPMPERLAGQDRDSRYWIDLASGDGYGTDDIDEVCGVLDRKVALNVRDRHGGAWLVWQRKIDHGPHNPLSPLYDDGRRADGRPSKGHL